MNIVMVYFHNIATFFLKRANKNNNYQVTLNNLPKGNYTIKELDKDNDFIVTYSNVDLDESTKTYTATITNTLIERISIKVYKKWYGNTVDDIQFDLYRKISNGKEENITNESFVKQNINKDNNPWIITYSNLPESDQEGNKYTYYVKEENNNKYDISYGKDKDCAYDGDTIYNSLKNEMSIEKKVKENSNKYIKNDGYNDVADYCVGDNVPFRIYSSLPNYSVLLNNTDAKYVISDIYEDSFDKPSDVKVYISKDKDFKDSIELSKNNYIYDSKDNSFTITISNIMSLTNNIDEYKYVIVDYQAKLNNKANIGLKGNTNKVKLTYLDKDTDYDEVIVYTYELDVNKVDLNDSSKITGAKFILYKLEDAKIKYAIIEDSKVVEWSLQENKATQLESNDDGLFKIIGLDDYIYFLKEIEAPKDYLLLVSPIQLSITANTNNDKEYTGSPLLTDLSIKQDNKVIEGNINTGVCIVNITNEKVNSDAKGKKIEKPNKKDKTTTKIKTKVEQKKLVQTKEKTKTNDQYNIILYISIMVIAFVSGIYVKKKYKETKI